MSSEDRLTLDEICDLIGAQYDGIGFNNNPSEDIKKILTLAYKMGAFSSVIKREDPSCTHPPTKSW